MKLFKMIIMILFICFNFILNEPIPIQNFQTITIPEGTTEYVYHFSEPTLQVGKDAYFFFALFSYNSITLTIRDEDNKENSITVNSNDIYCGYKIQNLKPQKYIFVIKNSSRHSELMNFIDNSREINIKLANLMRFHFDTKTIEGNPPLPLIFNLDSIEEKSIINFDNIINKYNLYDGNYKL